MTMKHTYNMRSLMQACGLFIIPILFMPNNARAFTFQDAIAVISNHESVQSIQQRSIAITEEGKNKSSWGDPNFKVSAKNFPVESLSYDQTPMTGIEFGISQNVPITAKYKKTKDAYSQFSQATDHQSKHVQQQLIKDMWLVLIEKKNIDEEIRIIDENLQWISNMIQVSERLYSNGKISQQALLDVKIRQSELEALHGNKVMEAEQQIDVLGYLLGIDQAAMEIESIPWHILDQEDSQPLDTKQKSYELELDAKTSAWQASKRDRVPDVTLSLGYTLRSDIDQNGDFISTTIGFPLPLVGKRSSATAKALHEKKSSELNLGDYKKSKESQLRQHKHEIEKITKELSILNKRTIEFAQNSRKITSKAYSLGSSTYIELLQSELKLQNLLLQQNDLEAALSRVKITYKFTKGDKLHD